MRFTKKVIEIVDPESQEVLGYHSVLVGTGKTLREGDIDNNIPATLYLDGVKREVRSGRCCIACKRRSTITCILYNARCK